MYQATLSLAPIRPDSTATELAEKLVQKLQEVRGRNISIRDDTVLFTGGMFRWVTNWNVLVPITRGAVFIDKKAMLIRYRLTFTQVVFVVPLSIAIVLIMAAANGFPVPTATLVAFFFIFCFGLVGTNVAIGILRFDSFLRRCLREAGFIVIAEKKSEWTRFRK